MNGLIVRTFSHADGFKSHSPLGLPEVICLPHKERSGDSVDFGSYHVLSPGTKRVQARLSDEALYALALYIYSLKPPPNPNPRNQPS